MTIGSNPGQIPMIPITSGIRICQSLPRDFLIPRARQSISSRKGRPPLPIPFCVPSGPQMAQGPRAWSEEGKGRVRPSASMCESSGVYCGIRMHLHGQDQMRRTSVRRGVKHCEGVGRTTGRRARCGGDIRSDSREAWHERAHFHACYSLTSTPRKMRYERMRYATENEVRHGE